MGSSAQARLAAHLARRWPDRATVYGVTTATGRHETVLKTGLRCYLATVSAPAPVGGDRAALARQRRLLWEGDYAMPTNVRVRINDQADLWTVVRGTETPVPPGSAEPAYWRAELTRG